MAAYMNKKNIMASNESPNTSLVAAAQHAAGNNTGADGA